MIVLIVVGRRARDIPPFLAALPHMLITASSRAASGCSDYCSVQFSREKFKDVNALRTFGGSYESYTSCLSSLVCFVRRPKTLTSHREEVTEVDVVQTLGRHIGNYETFYRR